MEEITVWSRKYITRDSEGKIINTTYKHNHIQVEWVSGDKPQPHKPEYTNQLSWNNLEWKREYGYLIDNKVVINVFNNLFFTICEELKIVKFVEWLSKAIEKLNK